MMIKIKRNIKYPKRKLFLRKVNLVIDFLTGKKLTLEELTDILGYPQHVVSRCVNYIYLRRNLLNIPIVRTKDGLSKAGRVVYKYTINSLDES